MTVVFAKEIFKYESFRGLFILGSRLLQKMFVSFQIKAQNRICFITFSGQDHREALILVHHAVFSMTMDLVLREDQACMDHSIHFAHASIVITISRIIKLIHCSVAPI